MFRNRKFVLLFAILLALALVGVKPVYLAATTLPQDDARGMSRISPQAGTERDFDEFDERAPISSGTDESTNIRNQILDVLSELFEPFDLFSVMLNDGSFGWEPDGKNTTFTIDDVRVHPFESTVLVNTIQENYVVCAVDYLYSDGYFEVNCNDPPADGATLKYVVINQEPEVYFPLGNETERFENVSGSDIDEQERIDRTFRAYSDFGSR